jgi:hypothetical protein
MTKIPKSFNLAGIKWGVRKDTKKELAPNRFAHCDPDIAEILYTTELNGRKVPEDILLLTIYHEKIHAILETMGKEELSKDEAFVDMFANLLLQSDLTSKY